MNKIDIDKMPYGELVELVNKLKEKDIIFPSLSVREEKKRDPYEVGRNYFIRTITHHYTGCIVDIFENEIVLEDVCWIADDGRFSDAMKDFKIFEEIEPYPEGKVIIGRGAILDAHVNNNDLPKEQK